MPHTLNVKCMNHYPDWLNALLVIIMNVAALSVLGSLCEV